MAKAAVKVTKKAVKPVKEVTAKKPKATMAEGKYGISDLADAMGLKPASVRVKLRQNGIEKNGKGYHFATMAEVNELAKSLSKDGRAKKAA